MLFCADGDLRSLQGHAVNFTLNDGATAGTANNGGGMKIGIAKLIRVAAIAALVVIAGSTGAWAQNCPTSPNYLPDFSSNQNCLALTNTARAPDTRASTRQSRRPQRG